MGGAEAWMGEANRERNLDRIRSAVAVAAFHILLGYGLITGLGFEPDGATSQTLKLFDVRAEPPPVEDAVPAEASTKAPEGAASPANLRAEPSPVVAPPPEIRLEVPPPVVAAPAPGPGSDSSAGASDVPGPGTGSGGEGTGTGSGRDGKGAGGGVATRARLVSGELFHSDYPRAAKKAGIGGRVFVRIAVGTDGRVSRCTVTRSSGNAELDETSCRLIEQRYRFEPARDARGRSVPDAVVESHVWWTRPRRGA